MPSSGAIVTVWALSLGLFVVVLAVVALLLWRILSTARRIESGVGEIWNVGQKVANNTIHVALLQRTNHTAGRILSAAERVAAAGSALARHAAACPGCPRCLRGGP